MDDTSIDSRASSMMGMADSIDSMNVGYDSEMDYLQQNYVKLGAVGAGDAGLAPGPPPLSYLTSDCGEESDLPRDDVDSDVGDILDAAVAAGVVGAAALVAENEPEVKEPEVVKKKEEDKREKMPKAEKEEKEQEEEVEEERPKNESTKI
jgi:hypothetical protein